jgi:hypothetical protein
MHRKLKTNPYADTMIPRCIGYYEAFKNPNQPSDIYKAIDNVVSFLSYKNRPREGSEADPNPRGVQYGTRSQFYLPVIVLDGNLFEAAIVEDRIEDRIEVTEQPHIKLHTYHREKRYMIDIVTREYFATFVDMVESFHEEIVSAIKAIELPEKFTELALIEIKRDEP